MDKVKKNKKKVEPIQNVYYEGVQGAKLVTCLSRGGSATFPGTDDQINEMILNNSGR